MKMLEISEEKSSLPITPCTKEIINLLSSDIPLIGLNSGIPTRTTATLTPTTMRNIEQTCIEIQCQVESHQNQAGFVPPPLPSNQSGILSLVDTKRWQGGSTRISEPRSISFNSCMTPNKTINTPQPKRNPGGRKPIREADISPEEEERRVVRRERNKMAAARCRKRRLDHTNMLVEETDELEEKKQLLQNEIHQLMMQKEELEYILASHKPCCRLDPPSSPPDVKPLINEEGNVVPPVVVESPVICKKPNIFVVKPGQNARLGGSKRPDSLLVYPGPVNDGIPLTTPTNGTPFNFESLMDGGTGLTPVSGPLIPSCSTQQRNSDLLSPDSNKLVSL